MKITGYFKDILGCGLKRKKRELLNEIKHMEKTDSLAMIGDRLHDMNAGKECQCFCIGVLWGYGSQKELLDSGADIICANPDEIPKVIDRITTSGSPGSDQKKIMKST